MTHSKVPVLFLVFNRPEPTFRVFEAIKNYQPSRLYIASDGPRPSKENEAFIVEGIRKTILDSIDWPCHVQTLFGTHNLGCGPAVSGAISWFFDNEPWGIIIEDDCLPSPTFFSFCQELLVRYEHDNIVWQINGFNPKGSKVHSADYVFSSYAKIWGWATWRRAWINNDFKMSSWPLHRKKKTHHQVLPWCEAMIRAKVWNRIYRKIQETGKPPNWGPQWGLSIFLNKGLCISPMSNLVKNIGIGIDATNCVNKNHPYQFLDYGELASPLRHPSKIERDLHHDRLVSKEFFMQRYREIARKMRSFFS